MIIHWVIRLSSHYVTAMPFSRDSVYADRLKLHPKGASSHEQMEEKHPPTPEHLRILLGKSFEDIPGEHYNQYRHDATEHLGESHLFYELSLMEDKPWKFLRDRVYPLFARYLKAKRFDPANAYGVVVAVFHADRCYLLKGEDFLDVFRKMEGIDPAAFFVKVQQWLSL